MREILAQLREQSQPGVLEEKIVSLRPCMIKKRHGPRYGRKPLHGLEHRDTIKLEFKFPCMPMGHFGKYHNTFVCPPKILHKHCFQFLLGLTMVPRENKNNAYAKFGGTNKQYYGIFRNGLLQGCLEKSLK